MCKCANGTLWVESYILFPKACLPFLSWSQWTLSESLHRNFTRYGQGFHHDQSYCQVRHHDIPEDQSFIDGMSHNCGCVRLCVRTTLNLLSSSGNHFHLLLQNWHVTFQFSNLHFHLNLERHISKSDKGIQISPDVWCFILLLNMEPLLSLK